MGKINESNNAFISVSAKGGFLLLSKKPEQLCSHSSSMLIPYKRSLLHMFVILNKAQLPITIERLHALRALDNSCQVGHV